MVESLQPSWISFKASLWAYILITRLLVGIVVSLLLTLMIGFRLAYTIGLSGGLISAILEGYRIVFQFSNQRKSGFKSYVYITTSLFLFWSMIFAGTYFFVALTTYPYVGFILGALNAEVYTVTYGLRLVLLGSIEDIRTIEALSINIKAGIKTCLLGIGMGIFSGIITEWANRLIFGAGVWAMRERWVVIALLFAIVSGMAGFIFGCLTPVIRGQRTVPNVGIHWSLRNGFLVGIFGGAFISLVGGLFGGFFSNVITEYSVGLFHISGGICGGLSAGLIGGLLIALWFGWLDAIHHYILRCSLYKKLPLDLTGFLDYAERMTFVHKVGGGYIFMHRLLMEHFAAMHNGEANNYTEKIYEPSLDGK